MSIVLLRFAYISVSSLTYRYHSIVIADSVRGSIRFVAALYEDGYIHTTATVIGEYCPHSIRVFFSLSSSSNRPMSIVIVDSVRGSIRFVALYDDGYIRTTDISVIGEYRPPSICVYFRIIVV